MQTRALGLWKRSSLGMLSGNRNHTTSFGELPCGMISRNEISTLQMDQKIFD